MLECLPFRKSRFAKTFDERLSAPLTAHSELVNSATMASLTASQPGLRSVTKERRAKISLLHRYMRDQS